MGCFNNFCRPLFFSRTSRTTPHVRKHHSRSQIEVTFDLDANGILNVTAMDQTTRARANITINAGVGHLSTEEIERMVASAEKMKAEDELTMARIEAKNALERTIYYARETAAQRDSASIREALEAAQAWLDESPEMEVKDYRRETVKLEKAMKCVWWRAPRA